MEYIKKIRPQNSSNFIIRRIFYSAIFLFMFFVPYFVATATTTPALISTNFTVGTLVKGLEAEVFIYQGDGLLHWIPDEATFLANNFSWENIVLLDTEKLFTYKFGDSLPRAEQKNKTTWTASEIKERVTQYFADIPVMITVAKCESGFRQFNEDGTPLIGHNLYVGIYQIAEKIHADYAQSLGMDIYTVEGNMAYARRLYEQQGSKPWPTCSNTTDAMTQLGYPLTLDLQLDDTNAEVKIVQQILNSVGFPVAQSGVGSVGQETEYFGSLTKVAVQRFQCAKGIACDGSESTTGYGKVGPKTRSALLQTIQK